MDSYFDGIAEKIYQLGKDEKELQIRRELMKNEDIPFEYIKKVLDIIKGCKDDQKN